MTHLRWDSEPSRRVGPQYGPICGIPPEKWHEGVERAVMTIASILAYPLARPHGTRPADLCPVCEAMLAELQARRDGIKGRLAPSYPEWWGWNLG